MPQAKDYPDDTDPNYRQHYRGYHGGYARAEAGGGGNGNGERTAMKWVFGILASVVGGIIIIQLQFFGSAVIKQGEIVARLDERMAAMQDAVKKQGEDYARDRESFADRIGRLEQRGEGGGSNRNLNRQ